MEAFLPIPSCAGGVNLSNLLKEIEAEFGDKVEITIHHGRHELFEKHNLAAAPAVIVGGWVKIAGVCPSKVSLVAALRKAGLD